jgi:hypothetical protein
MPKQNYLVELIRALSTNEKRYFKLFSSLQPGEKRYLKLFDALDGKSTYDVAALSTETGLTVKQLTDDKYYLTQILLQSLHNFDNQSTSYRQLQSSKDNAIVLIARRQFAFALDIIDKALERAWELEAFELIDEMLFLRSRCKYGISRYAADLNISAQHKKCTALLNELVELVELKNLANKYFAEANNVVAYKKLLKHPLLSKQMGALHSLRAKTMYCEVWLNYYIVTFDTDKVGEMHRKEQTLYKQNPILKTISPLGYINNAIRLSTTETAVGNNLKAYNILEAVGEELAQGTLELTTQQFQSLKLSVASFKLWPLRHLHHYNDAVKICAEYYEMIQQRNEADKVTILFEYALSLMFNNNTSKAADIMDQLLRVKSNARSDMQPYIRILAIMIQLDLENYSLIPSLIKSTKLWLKKQNLTNAEFDLFFKHALQIAQSANRRTAWRNLNDDIKAAKFETMDKLIQFGYWVKQKVQAA